MSASSIRRSSPSSRSPRRSGCWHAWPRAAVVAAGGRRRGLARHASRTAGWPSRAGFTTSAVRRIPPRHVLAAGAARTRAFDTRTPPVPTPRRRPLQGGSSSIKQLELLLHRDERRAELRVESTVNQNASVGDIAGHAFPGPQSGPCLASFRAQGGRETRRADRTPGSRTRRRAAPGYQAMKEALESRRRTFRAKAKKSVGRLSGGMAARS